MPIRSFAVGTTGNSNLIEIIVPNKSKNVKGLGADVSLFRETTNGVSYSAETGARQIAEPALASTGNAGGLKDKKSPASGKDAGPSGKGYSARYFLTTIVCGAETVACSGL
jgi:hypothetical protein